MAYGIQLERAAARELEKIAEPWRERIRDRINKLADDPRPAGVAKLAGEENVWGIRVGDYRILYEIHDNQLIVLVVRVAHRREVYR